MSMSLKKLGKIISDFENAIDELSAHEMLRIAKILIEKAEYITVCKAV